MNDTGNADLPIFATTASPVFDDPAATKALFGPVFSELGRVVDIGEDKLAYPTPCQSYTVADLRRHVLGWLQFFAAALNDPSGEAERSDPGSWELAAGQRPADIVRQAAREIERSIDAGVAGQLVVMSQARMAGSGVLAMALGEYLVHGWDLAVSTGQGWEPQAEAAEPALAFLQTTVAPEHRGPDSGFFDEEVPTPAEASVFQQLLCFAGRNPAWVPSGKG